jgi:signal transduction histidine kinase
MNKYEKALERIKKNVFPADDWTDEGIEHYNTIVESLEHSKQIAREILQEVRQALLNMVLANSMGENYDIQKRFYEIEKKYTDATDTNVGRKTKENKKDAVTDVPIQLSIFDKEDNQ